MHTGVVRDVSNYYDQHPIYMYRCLYVCICIHVQRGNVSNYYKQHPINTYRSLCVCMHTYAVKNVSNY